MVERLFKVLSGPQLGAQSVLLEGTYSIGSALSNDLILVDAMIKPYHAQLMVEDNRMTIAQRDGRIIKNGQLSLEKNMLLEPFDVMTLGSTHISVGYVGREWPAIKLPSIDASVLYPPILPEEHLNGHTGEEAKEDGLQEQNNDNDNDNDADADAAEDSSKDKAAEDVQPNAGNNVWQRRIVGIAAACFIIIVLVTMFASFSSTNQGINVEVVQKLIADYPLLKLTGNKKTSTIVGFVDTDFARDTISKQLQQLGIRYEILSQEAILDSVSVYKNQLNLDNIEIRMDTQTNKLSISGTLSSRDMLVKLEEEAMRFLDKQNVISNVKIIPKIPRLNISIKSVKAGSDNAYVTMSNGQKVFQDQELGNNGFILKQIYLDRLILSFKGLLIEISLPSMEKRILNLQEYKG